MQSFAKVYIFKSNFHSSIKQNIMGTYKTHFIDKFPIDHNTADEDQIVLLMNYVATQIDNCVQYLGSVAEIKSIEHIDYEELTKL